MKILFLLLLFLQSTYTLNLWRHAQLLRQLAYSVDVDYGNKQVIHFPSSKSPKQPNDRNLAYLNRKNSRFLLDGDMLVSNGFLKNLVQDQKSRRSPRQAYKDRYYPRTIWTDGIPFEFDDNLPYDARTSLQRAMDFWQKETCVNFRPRLNESQHLYFTGAESGCFSTVGKDTSQPQQIVNIGQGCYHFGVTSHEVAHAIGLFHHQQRTDRDSFVQFLKDNVPSSYLQNFAKISKTFLSTYDTPYDVGSVMHYTPTEFATDRYQPALQAMDQNLQGTMGSMDKPSFLDVLLVNRHYNCSDLCNGQELPLCLNGGYVDPRNCTQCKCPTGFGGLNCHLIESSAPMPCGGLLPASYTMQRMRINLKAGPQRRQCVYHIRAPANRRVMIGLEKINGKCQEGCYTSGMEVKMMGDFRTVGYRFCCESHSFRRLVSNSTTAPISFFAQNGNVEAVLYYRWIVSTPDAEDTTILSDVDMMEVYKQQDGSSGINMTIASRRPPFRTIKNGRFLNDENIMVGPYGSDGASYQDFSVY